MSIVFCTVTDELTAVMKACGLPRAESSLNVPMQLLVKSAARQPNKRGAHNDHYLTRLPKCSATARAGPRAIERSDRALFRWTCALRAALNIPALLGEHARLVEYRQSNVAATML